MTSSRPCSRRQFLPATAVKRIAEAIKAQEPALAKEALERLGK